MIIALEGSDTVAEMRIDYDLAIKRAYKIRSLAESIHKVANDVKNAENDTVTIWEGYAADTYRNQCEVLENELLEIEMKMSKLSEAIIRIANAIKEADEQIAASAVNLAGGSGGGSW